MSTGDWTTKIQIIQKIKNKHPIFSGTSMGIYFEFNAQNTIVVYFKPLNENFKKQLFKEKEGVLIQFERDLIDEDDIEYALDVLALFNKYPQFQINELPQVQQIEQLIALLKGEFLDEKASPVMLKTLLKVLLLHLIRYQEDEFLKQDLNQKRVFQFLELMEATFLREKKTDFYARKMGMSSKRLNQILKEKLNLTAKQLIQQRQITASKRALIKGEMTTKELAFLLGFDSMSSFSRFFKKNVGVSPSTFKTES